MDFTGYLNKATRPERGQRSTRKRHVWSMNARPVSASTNSRAVFNSRPKISSSLSVEIFKNARASAIVTGSSAGGVTRNIAIGFPYNNFKSDSYEFVPTKRFNANLNII